MTSSETHSQGLRLIGGANPTVKRNRIHNGRQGGILVPEKGLGVIENNEIESNALSGVEIRQGGNCTVRGNQIRENQKGVYIHHSGQGAYEK